MSRALAIGCDTRPRMDFRCRADHAFPLTRREHAPPDQANVRELCMRIAIRFAKSDPTPLDIAEAFPMSRASAYRYLRALRDAKGQP